MFGHRQRRPPPFADFINWTDYRWEANPWQRPTAGSGTWGHPRPRRHGYSFLQILVAGLAVVLGVKLMSSLRNNGNRSWLERAVLAVLLLMVASFVSKRRQRHW